MQALGFSLYDIRLITLISALVSIIGPLIVGFILDRLSIKRPSAYGKWLRILLFIFFILAGLMFGSLLLVPAARIYRTESVDTRVTFSCNDKAGYVFIHKNVTYGQCTSIEGRTGGLKLFNCSYTCETPENFNYLYQQSNIHKAFEKIVDVSSIQSNENAEYDYDSEQPEAAPLIQAPTSPTMIPPPHICLNKSESGHCYVYLEGSNIKLVDLVGSKADEGQENNQFNEEWCKHPLGKKYMILLLFLKKFLISSLKFLNILYLYNLD